MWAAARDDDEQTGNLDDLPGADLKCATPLMHDGIPISGYHRGEPIPDLNALPQEAWLEALRPLRPWTRNLATARLRTVEQAREAAVIKGQLILEDPAPHARSAVRAPPRMPAGAPPTRGSRQINFRLGPEEHARLVEAAKLFAMRPTTLARTLTVRGVERALYEDRRDT